LRIDYQALAVLAAIVRTGSFEGAAKTLGVTQSATSQRIRQLEEEVGSILVVRGRPCVPTASGLTLFRHFEQVELLQAETVSELLGDGEQAPATSVRVSANYDSLATWFPHVIRAASDELNLRIEVVPDDQEFTELLLRSGEVLAALSVSTKSIPGCSRQQLGVMDYVAVASPEFHARYFASGVTVDTAAHAPSIVFDAKDTLPNRWMTEALGASRPLRSHQVPSYEGHLVCCANGAGWAMMPLLTVGPMIESGELVDLAPGRRVSITLNWYFVNKTNRILAGLSDIVARQARERITC
jgi:LysR family transcriptional regulator (chromosome initiation inhibitor)